MTCVLCLEDVDDDDWRCRVCLQRWCAACHDIMVKRHEEDADVSLDPCPYGAPRCPCGGDDGSAATCLRRPCHNSADRGIMLRWERDDPMAHRQWVEDETVASLRKCRRQQPTGVTCPVCRAVVQKKK